MIEAAPRAGLRVWRALADREEGCPEETGGGQEEGCPEETEGGQEEGCPEEEMSPASSPMRMAVPSSAQACSAANAVYRDD